MLVGRQYGLEVFPTIKKTSKTATCSDHKEKLSYRTETACQLYACLSRLANWSCYSLNTADVVAKVVSFWHNTSVHQTDGQTDRRSDVRRTYLS